MAVFFTENFNEGQAAFDLIWNNVGFVALRAGGCTIDGYWVACTDGYAKYTFPSSVSAIAVRNQLAAIVDAAVVTGDSNEVFWIEAPGINPIFTYEFIVGFAGDGSIAFRMNNGSSGVFSSAGLVPVDGSLFTFQYRINITGAHTMDVNFDVNNVNVWSFSYDWTVWDAPGGLGISEFTAYWIRPNYTSPVIRNLGIDNIAIDDSDATVTMSLCAVISLANGCSGRIPPPVIDDINIDCATGNIVITGSLFPTNPTVTLTVNGNTVSNTIVFATDTQIVVHPITFVNGNWCALVQ